MEKNIFDIPSFIGISKQALVAYQVACGEAVHCRLFPLRRCTLTASSISSPHFPNFHSGHMPI
jgi:hypothetical protein